MLLFKKLEYVDIILNLFWTQENEQNNEQNNEKNKGACAKTIYGCV